MNNENTIKRKERKKYLKQRLRISLKLMSDTKQQIQEAQKTLSRINDPKPHLGIPL